MSCIVSRKNFSRSNCNQLPSLLKGAIWTPLDFNISEANLATQALLLTALQTAALDVEADRIFKFPDFSNYEDVSEEQVYQATPLNPQRPVRDGKYAFRFGISESICIHKALFTHRGTTGRLIFIDSENQLIGTELSDGSFAGFTVQTMHSEKMKFNTGSETSESPFLVVLLDNKEFDKTGMIVQLDTINEMYRITDVVLTIVGTPSATTIVVDVKAECDDEPISGLVVADFLLVDDDDSAVHAISTAVESSSIPGRYTLTGVSFEDSTLTLDPPSGLSIQAYESTGAVAVNIP